jgi:broad specificity phosphatase PhoE
MNRLLLVRHGDIAADMSRYWGHTDVPLSSNGLKHAEKLRDRLASEKIDIVHSSDLKRTLDTATIIAMPHRLAVITSHELREIDFGQCEGLTFSEMKERHPETEGIWTADGQNIRFPGGESVLALTERLTTFAERLRSESCGRALVVAHGGSLRVLICCLAGLEISAWREMRIERASLTIIEIEGRRGKILLLNDVSHLGIKEVSG